MAERPHVANLDSSSLQGLHFVCITISPSQKKNPLTLLGETQSAWGQASPTMYHLLVC